MPGAHEPWRHGRCGKKADMNDMIERLGVLLKAEVEERRQLDASQTQLNAELDAEKEQSQKRIEELKTEIPARFREIADVYPAEFSCDDGQGEASPGSITCELVWTKQPPRRHLRVILTSDATDVQVQWLRDGLKADYAHEVAAENFDAAYLERLVTELVSSKRWGQNFYPIL